MDNYPTCIPPRRTAQQGRASNGTGHTPRSDDDRPAQMPRSALRYVNTEGHEVIERGNKRMVIHRQSPPPAPRRRHWLFLVGVGMLVMIALLLAGNWAVLSWQAHQIDSTYGYPRTWQTDAVVGHNDSPSHPSHFIFLNLHAHVVIIEMPGGDISHARIYSGPTLFGSDGEKAPITGDFEDTNGDGKVDMVVHIQGQTIVYLNDGAELKTQQ